MTMSNTHILVVDDDADTRQILSDFLEMYGYQTTSAASAHEASSALNTEKIDLLITDIQLPDGSGMDVVKLGKSLQPQLKVIICSGFEQTPAEILNEETLWMTKPLQIDTLFTRIEALTCNHLTN